MSEHEEEHAPIVEVEGSEELDLVRKALLEGDITLEVDPEAIARQIVEQIITAPSVDAAFHERPVWHANESIGRRYVLRGVRWLPSNVAGGPALFAAVDVVDLDTGEVGIMTTSGFKQLAKLYVLDSRKGFPRTVENTQSMRPTAAGYYPLDFVDVEQPEQGT